MKVAVVRFPASNCDLDAVASLAKVEGVSPSLVWHEDPSLAHFEAVILPGGFSFGDCLRAGAIAARSPAISVIKLMAAEGRPVLGICNGFQILVEAGLLPGALLRNAGLKFVCKWVNLRVENDGTAFTRGVSKSRVLRMPIAHGEGRFFLPDPELRQLEKSGRVVFRYCDDEGKAVESANPTGSADNIAGITNSRGNVVGLMPHPERAADPILSPFHSADGMLVLRSLVGGAA